VGLSSGTAGGSVVGAVAGSLSCAARSLSDGRGTNAGGEIVAIRAGAPSSRTLVSDAVGDECDISGGAEAVCPRSGASGTASGEIDCLTAAGALGSAVATGLAIPLSTASVRSTPLDGFSSGKTKGDRGASTVGRSARLDDLPGTGGDRPNSSSSPCVGGRGNAANCTAVNAST
jgi:hypothetical protein